MLRIGRYVFGRLDWSEGQFTYGNRIAFSEILKDETLNEFQALKKIYKEVYGYSSRWLPRPKRYRVFKMILHELEEWIDREQKLLHYEPTEDQKKAGVEKFAKAVGDMATIKAIAKDYGREPDEVLRWDYGKVFGILYTDLEEHKYNDRYNKVVNERIKNENRKYRK